LLVVLGFFLVGTISFVVAEQDEQQQVCINLINCNNKSLFQKDKYKYSQLYKRGAEPEDEGLIDGDDNDEGALDEGLNGDRVVRVRP